MSAIYAERYSDNGALRFNWRRALALTLGALREAGILRSAVVVVIGSHAQRVATPQSDLDILVLSDELRPKIKTPRGIHLQFRNTGTFRQRLRDGDDYAVAATRFGKVLYDRHGVWPSIREEAQNAPWPDWKHKIEFAQERLRLAEELLSTGDLSAAVDQIASAATQIARAELLRRSIFPESRPQLASQLLAVGNIHLSEDLSRLLSSNVNPLHERDLRSIANRLSESIAYSKGRRMSVGDSHGQLVPYHPRHLVCVAIAIISIMPLFVTLPFGQSGYVLLYSVLAIGLGVFGIDWLIWAAREEGKSDSR